MQLAMGIRQMRKNVINPKQIDWPYIALYNQGKDVNGQGAIAQAISIFHKILLRLVSTAYTVAAVIALNCTGYEMVLEVVAERGEVRW